MLPRHGKLLSGIAAYQMSHFSLDMNSWPVITSAIIQGLGTSMIFVPLTTLAFASLNPIYRADGSALFTLVRNLGSSAGISIVEALQTNNVEVVHSGLVSHITPGDPHLSVLAQTGMNPATVAGAAALNGEITRQAAMVAYIDDFYILFILAILLMPVLLLMRSPRRVDTSDALAVE